MNVTLHNINQWNLIENELITKKQLFVSDFHNPEFRKTIEPNMTKLLTITEKDNIYSYMFIVPKKKLFIKYHLQLPFVLYNNPVILTSATNNYKKYKKVREVLITLTKYIKKNFYIFYFQAIPEFNYLLPFYWEKFKLSLKTTFVIDNKNFYNQYSNTIRRKIKKAEDKIKIVRKNSTDIFLYLYKNSGKKFLNSYQQEVLNRLIKNTEIINMYVAENNSGEPLASAIFYDGKKENYYLLGTQDKKAEKSHSLALLLHKYIEKTINKNKVFNFEGSNIEGIERFFRSFGAKPIIYPTILYKKL